MKNLFTLFAIILGLGLANAQTKKPVAKKTDAPTKTLTPTATKGPTKEETQNYILNELKNDSKIYFSKYSKEKGATAAYDIFTSYNLSQISFEDCTLRLKIRKEYKELYETRLSQSDRIVETTLDVVIPLNKMEIISFIDDEIVFESVNGLSSIALSEEKIRKHPSYVLNKQDEVISVETVSKADWNLPYNLQDPTKLTKAFNHLRKLCGAPEPISFD